MPPTINRPGLATGQKHHIRVASRDWTGVLRRLVDDREGTFKAHLPLRPRGPQVVIDPFPLHAARCNVRGTVFSPGRVLDPTSTVEAWIDGTAVAGINAEGQFGATVTLHAGHDQIHVRAKDLTQREGRGYVGTWIPGEVAPPEEPVEVEPPRTQRIRMRLEDEDGEALAHLPYELTCAGERFEGVTDDNGYLTHQVPASAATGELTFWLDEDKSGESYTWPLRIADIAQPPTSGGGAASVGRGAAAVWCGTLGGFVRAAQAAPDDDDLPPPQPIQRPARYGSVRAEVQRFLINPPLRGEGLTADLVLKDDQDAEVGRCTVKLEKTQLGTATEWVCITAADPSADPPPAAVEGKLIRVPSVKHTIEIKVGEVLIGNRPVRFSGWDPSTPPTPMTKVERDAPVEVPLGGVVGGAFEEPEQLGLRWMVDADADDVLLPSSATAEEDSSLEDATWEHAPALAGEDPVDLTEQKAQAPLGWAALGVEGLAAEDPFPEEQAHAVVTYQEATSTDAPEADDFALSPRKLRVVWHDTDEWSCHPDQLVVSLKEGTDDEALKALVKKVGMEVAGTVRRDGSVLLETKEPVSLDELTSKLDAVKAESCVAEASYNSIGAQSSEDVASIRVPNLLRSPTPNPGHPTQLGGVQPFELLALRHHFQMRSLPAQQLVEKLRAACTGPQPTVLMGVADSGFGRGQADSLGPDFPPARLPLGARNVYSLNTVRTLTHPVVFETVTNGHGTLVAHCMAGGGAPFLGLDAVQPPLSATAPLSLRNDPWSLGTCPMAQLVPIRIADPTGSASTFAMMSAVRWAFNQTGVRVVNLSYGGTYTAADLVATGLKSTETAIFRPALVRARDVGGILVIAAGNDGSPLHRRFPGHFGPTAARTATTHPAVVVTPTSQTLVTSVRLGSAFPHTFPSPWGSFETRRLRAGGAWVASFGPQASISAPGDALCLRLSTLTAPRRRNQVDAGAGTSFSAPLVAGLFGLMHVADQLVNPGPARTGTAANDFANKLIALMQYTAHRDAPLFTAAEATAQFSNVLGHGRIDVWAAILSTLNGGPMQTATAPHAHISGNIGAFVTGTSVKYYGLELDTRAYHARPMFVNVDTGVAEGAVDSHGLDPAIDATDPTRPVWSYLLRDGGGKDEVLPCTEHPGPDGWYTTQLSIARERLQAYTHLVFKRPGAPSSYGLVEGAPVGNVYYGLPLAPLLNHDTTGADIAPFRVDARHFIFKARTEEHDRRLRVTFDRVELGITAGVGDWSLTGTAGSESTGAQTVRGSGVRPLVLAGPAWSKVVHVTPGDGLTIALSGTGPGGEAVGPMSVSFTGQTTPADPSTLPFGIGRRRLTSGPLVLHVTIAHEPALGRRWKAELLNVRCSGEVESGDYRFAVEVDGARSDWTAIQASSQAEADDQAQKIQDALAETPPNGAEVCRILEAAASLERRALEHRWRATRRGSLRDAIREKLAAADRDRAIAALDDPRALSTDSISVEGAWLPGQGPRVGFRWQDRSSLRGDMADDRPSAETLAARSATGECVLRAGPFTATVKISSV